MYARVHVRTSNYGENMNAYILFTESVVYFTPSAVTLIDHKHVTIKVVTPRPFLRKRRRNTGQHEIAVHIPPRFNERFWVFVYLDKHPRQKWRNWFALEIEVDGGIITDVMTYMNRCPEDLNPQGIMVKYPSGAYDTSGYEWHKYQMP